MLVLSQGRQGYWVGGLGIINLVSLNATTEVSIMKTRKAAPKTVVRKSATKATPSADPRVQHDALRQLSRRSGMSSGADNPAPRKGK